METIKLKINGIEVTAPKGSTILEAARLAHIEIPTLCFLKEINEIGACRVCIVELKNGKLVTSCVYPAEDGMEVFTNTPKVMDSRKKTIQLLLSNHNRSCLSCVRSGHCELQELARELGVEDEGYYDGANLNAVMGVVRPGDMGFDCIHMNLHKTFATPHGGGGPGAGAVGCKAFLEPYLPQSAILSEGEHLQVRAFNGNFLVVVKALAYLLTLGREGIPEAAENAVLNANYLMRRIQGTFQPAFDRICMHEFVLGLEEFKKETGVSALDVAKSLIDRGIHPPTMYFPLIVHEALMLEPTETESRETLDQAAEVFRQLYQLAHTDPEAMRTAPHNAQIGRPDEVQAARNPILRWQA
mgnify:CR=1 FL=1